MKVYVFEKNTGKTYKKHAEDQSQAEEYIDSIGDFDSEVIWAIYNELSVSDDELDKDFSSYVEWRLNN